MGLTRACSKLRCTSAQVLESLPCECEFLHTQCDVAAGICYLRSGWLCVAKFLCQCSRFLCWPCVPLLGVSSVESNSRRSQAHLTGFYRVWRHSLVPWFSHTWRFPLLFLG